MTFSVGHVEGGTGAGRKRPLRDKPKPWECDRCMDDLRVTALYPAYRTACDHGHKRPEHG